MLYSTLKSTANKSPKQIPTAPDIHQPVKLGLIILIGFLGGFLLWAAIAPLESGSVATGKIIVDTNRKNVQHLEGGIVHKIYVREGSIIKADDPLIKLDETQTKARLQLAQSQLNELTAAEARLIAERDNAENIIFPNWLVKKSITETQINQIIKGQQAIFTSHKKSFQDNIAILQQRIKQLNEEILSLKSQATSYENQLKLINEEIQAILPLLEKQYIDRPRYLALKREAERLTGNRDEQLALAARTEQKIGETKMQMLGLESEQQNKIVEELRKTQNDLADAVQRNNSAEDILARTLIKAPRSGKVVNLQVHTIGGVITPGQTILDIVPDDDPLVIEARINPSDIDIVHPGLTARVRLTAYKQRTTPVLSGKVTEVSADSILDPRTQEHYFNVRIAIDAQDLKHIKNIKLYPGMPAQALIVSDKQTLLTYLFKPIRDSFDRAFREQ